MDVKIDKCDMEFLENKNIKKSVKMKYIEEHFKDKKHIHDTKLKYQINKKERFRMWLHSAIFLLFLYTIVSIVYIMSPFVKEYTSSISKKVQNDK